MSFLNVKRANLHILTLGDSRSDIDVRVTLWPNQLHLPAGATMANFANSGWGLTDLAAVIPSSIAPYITARPTANFFALIGPMGANDIGSYTASSYAAYLADNIIEPLRALGVAKIGLFTEMHTADPTHNALRDQLNVIYRTGSVGGNPVTIVDVAADPVMAPDQEHYTNPALYGNTEWWVDTTHQGAKGDAIYAGYADAAIAAMGVP